MFAFVFVCLFVCVSVCLSVGVCVYVFNVVSQISLEFLTCSINFIQSHAPLAVDLHWKMSSVFGIGRFTNFDFPKDR